jgi:hypothetical protein
MQPTARSVSCLHAGAPPPRHEPAHRARLPARRCTTVARSAGRRGASLRAQRLTPTLERHAGAASTTTTRVEQEEVLGELLSGQAPSSSAAAAKAGGTGQRAADAETTTEGFNQELHALAERSDDRGAMAVFNRMRAAGAQPDLTTFNHIFRACKKVRRRTATPSRRTHTRVILPSRCGVRLGLPSQDAGLPESAILCPLSRPACVVDFARANTREWYVLRLRHDP